MPQDFRFFEQDEQEDQLFGQSQASEAAQQFYERLNQAEERARRADKDVIDWIKNAGQEKKKRKNEVYESLIKDSFGFTPNTKGKKVGAKAAEIGATLLGSMGLPIFGMRHSQKARSQSEEDYAQTLKALMDNQRTASTEFRQSFSPQERMLGGLNRNITTMRGQDLKQQTDQEKLRQGNERLGLEKQELEGKLEKARHESELTKARIEIELARKGGVEAQSRLMQQQAKLAEEMGVDPKLLGDPEVFASLVAAKKIKPDLDLTEYGNLLRKGQGSGQNYTWRHDGMRSYYDEKSGNIVNRPAYKAYPLPSKGGGSNISGTYTQQGGVQRDPATFAQHVRGVTGMETGHDVSPKEPGLIELGNTPEEVKKNVAIKNSSESLARATGQLMNGLNSGKLGEYRGIVQKYLGNARAALGFTSEQEVQDTLLESLSSMQHLFAQTPKSNPPIQLINSIKGAVSNPSDSPEVYAKRLLTQRLAIDTVWNLKRQDKRMWEIAKTDRWDDFYKALEYEVELAVSQGTRKSKGQTDRDAVAPTIDMVLNRMEKLRDKASGIKGRSEFDKKFGVK